MKQDIVFIGDLLSFRYLEDWAFSHGYDEWLHQWIEPHWLAWLVVLLKEMPDDPNVFVHGKWATIQRIETKLLEAVKDEIESWPLPASTTEENGE